MHIYVVVVVHNDNVFANYIDDSNNFLFHYSPLLCCCSCYVFSYLYKVYMICGCKRH